MANRTVALVTSLPGSASALVRAIVIVLALTHAAAAEPPTSLAPEVQADVGLAVIGVGYERPLASHFAVMGEAQIFGTYFLPWFDAGDDVKGLGGQVRATWFARASGRGLYIMGFARADAVRGDVDHVRSEGYAVSGGAAAGWVFGLGNHVDLRVGAGAQYIKIDGDQLDTSTPFITLDTVVGYRL